MQGAYHKIILKKAEKVIILNYIEIVSHIN